MEKRGSYTLGEYQGGYSTLDPNKAYGTDFTGYRTKASLMGATTKPDTANQIQQVNQLLNQGMVPIEVTTLKPDVFETIPKEHFKELNRMAKLTGSKLSVHAPLIEPSGLGEQGWSPYNRELNERQLKEVVDKAYHVSDKERVPITIHASNLPGSEWMPKKGGKEGEAEREKIFAYDKESGRTVPIERKEKFYPGEISEKGEGKPFSPEERLDYQNRVKWEDEIDQLLYRKERVDEMLRRQGPHVQEIGRELEKYSKEEREKVLEETGETKKGYRTYQNMKTYLDDLQRQLKDDFEKAWKYARSEEDKKELRRLSERYTEKVENLNKDPANLTAQSEAIQDLIQGLRSDIDSPKQFVPIEEFAKEQSSQTFGNVALEAYKKYGKRAPQINIENLYTGMAFGGRTEDMNELIKESKESFVKNAKK